MKSTIIKLINNYIRLSTAFMLFKGKSLERISTYTYIIRESFYSLCCWRTYRLIFSMIDLWCNSHSLRKNVNWYLKSSLFALTTNFYIFRVSLHHLIPRSFTLEVSYCIMLFVFVIINSVSNYILTFSGVAFWKHSTWWMHTH